MNKLIILCVSIFISLCSFGQNNDGKKVELKFKTRVAFYSVTDRYQLIKDTIYHADDGFRVFSGYDIEKASNGKEYVIFRYNNWRGSKQVKDTIRDQQETLLLDSLFLYNLKNPYTDDSVKAQIYSDILDSLSTLAKNELDKKPVHVDVVGRNGLKLALLKSEFEKLSDKGLVEDVYSLKCRHATRFATGFMTVPFKLRPKEDTVNFNMTTDITLGSYIGVKRRLTRKGNNHIVFPVTLGLSFINITNNETTNIKPGSNNSVTPGFTWSTGVIFDIDGFNLGFVLGQDYASGIGEDWIYNKKLWYSFSIGYSFFNNKDK